MSKKWIKLVNLVFGGISLLLLLTILCLKLLLPTEINISEKIKTSRPLPPPPFSFPSSVYESMGNSLFKLHFAPPKIELPDLRSLLVYYGTNSRPDANIEMKPLFLGINNTTERLIARPQSKIYLMFDRKLKPPSYVFSLENKETPLWIELEAEGEDLLVKVKMSDENGELVVVPEEHREFTLKPEENPRFGGKRNVVWEIGKFRVDATLLARQKARWYGKDLFIEQHGGKEYADIAGKERVDFTDGDNTSSVYLGVNDVVIWKDDRWQQAKMGEETRSFPLMQVKKIEERLMTLELWDASGQSKVTMNILKSREPWIPKRLEKEFKFIAARTRTQYVFEIKDVRTILKPQDWLLQTEKEWVKLSTIDEIDDYVKRKSTGILFIFDGPIKTEEGQQALRGHFYNASRTETETIEIPTQATNLTIISNPQKDDKNQKLMQNQPSPSVDENKDSDQKEPPLPLEMPQPHKRM